MSDVFNRIGSDLRSRDKTKVACAFIAEGIPVLLTFGIGEDGNCSCGKMNCESPGKHPIGQHFRKGHKSATLDKNKIKRALKTHPDANLAICPPDTLVVLDIDGEEGLKTYEALKLPKTATVQTGRGYHCYFKGDASSFHVHKLPGIDIKTSNGYVVVPPSKHHSGGHYKWLG